MAPPSPPSLSLTSLHPNNNPNLDSARALVSLVSRHSSRLLSDPLARTSLARKCTTNLKTRFESSDHSVLSSLHLGIEALDEALSDQETETRLASSEKMLQIPASLDEEGTTAGVSNRRLVCFAYFYLSLVRKLRGDEWQMTIHLLQSVLVSSHCVRTELAPDLWGRLFGFSGSDEAARKQARKFKDWLMYYRVVSYGEKTTPWGDDRELPDARSVNKSGSFASMGRSGSSEKTPSWPAFKDVKMIYPLDIQENVKKKKTGKVKPPTSNSDEEENLTEMAIVKPIPANFSQGFHQDNKESFDIRCLQDMLEESQSDTSCSFYSHHDCNEESDYEEKKLNNNSPRDIFPANEDIVASQAGEREPLRQCLPPECSGRYSLASPTYPAHVEAYEMNASYLLSSRSHSSINNLSFSILDFKKVKNHPYPDYYIKDEAHQERSPRHDFRCFSNFSSRFLKKCNLPELVHHGSSARKKLNFSDNEKSYSEESSNCEKDIHIELLSNFEKALSALCYSEGTGKCEDADAEVTTLWEMLNKKTQVKYSSFKREILDQLLDMISTSKKEKVIRVSVSTLLILISEDRTVIEHIKRKDLHLFNLAGALKRNVHEAAIIIYLLKPPPSDIKNLELLPALVEVACNSNIQKVGPISLPLTPTSASIAMIESLVTDFDYVTNNMHLAAISSPQVLAKLVNVAMNKNLGESVALAAILVRCMRLNGNCKKFLSQVTPVDPFLHLLRSDDKRATFSALEYFNEILRMPRTSAIHLLRQIQQQGSTSIMYTLMACIEQSELEHRILAANLLLQMNMLGNSKGEFREEAMRVLLESVASEENSSTQMLSAFMLSNLGGTYAWTGEPYTSAWLVKKAGLTSAYHRNMIRNVDWFDPCLQDSEITAWSIKTAKCVFKSGSSVFLALAKGIQSKIKNVSRDCLICIAWLGSEMAAISQSNLRYTACEIVLNEITRFLHPGSELDERILACLCVYNYTSGKGKQKLINFSEGLRESLRRLSGITWMADELLKVTDYFLPTKPRLSCVHTQILEVGQVGTGAVTALIFYKGELYCGYSDGSIKVWDIKGQRGTVMWDAKEHTRPITCFTLFESGESLLSGSSDKTVRVWKMAHKKLECIEVIDVKEPVQKLDVSGDKILIITQSCGLKVRHASRNIEVICKSKHVKCLAVAQGKVYLGSADSSIQEVDIVGDHKTEIKAPTSSWSMRKKPINSVLVYKDWVYCAGMTVEGSSIKEWRRCKQPHISLTTGRGANIQTMAVVEDFIYLNCSSSRSIIQVWLRGKQQKVGRLSAGSRITSLLTGNDIVLCGTETGLIKGWIPL